MYNSIGVTDMRTGRTSAVPFALWNELGYMFTVATGREYQVAWKTPVRIDPVSYM